MSKRNDDYSIFSWFDGGDTPGVDSFSERMICIPVHWGLTQEELHKVKQAANQFALEHSA